MGVRLYTYEGVIKYESRSSRCEVHHTNFETFQTSASLLNNLNAQTMWFNWRWTWLMGQPSPTPHKYLQVLRSIYIYKKNINRFDFTSRWCLSRLIGETDLFSLSRLKCLWSEIFSTQFKNISFKIHKSKLWDAYGKDYWFYERAKLGYFTFKNARRLEPNLLRCDVNLCFLVCLHLVIEEKFRG